MINRRLKTRHGIWLSEARSWILNNGRRWQADEGTSGVVGKCFLVVRVIMIGFIIVTAVLDR